MGFDNEELEQSLKTQLLLHRPDIYQQMQKEEEIKEFKEMQARPESEEDIQDLIQSMREMGLNIQ